jgi:hypothetical protein
MFIFIFIYFFNKSFKKNYFPITYCTNIQHLNTIQEDPFLNEFPERRLTFQQVRKQSSFRKVKQKKCEDLLIYLLKQAARTRWSTKVTEDKL